MTTFIDGPAKGQTLTLKRAPYFLRVVVDADGKWDALDQVDDEPKPTEKVHVYEIIAAPGIIHLNRGNKGSGWYVIGTYRLYAHQPADDDVRETKRWQTWADAQKEIVGIPFEKCFLHPDKPASKWFNVPCAPGGKIFVCAECEADPGIMSKVWKKHQTKHGKEIELFKTPGNPGN